MPAGWTRRRERRRERTSALTSLRHLPPSPAISLPHPRSHSATAAPLSAAPLSAAPLSESLLSQYHRDELRRRRAATEASCDGDEVSARADYEQTKSGQQGADEERATRREGTALVTSRRRARNKTRGHSAGHVLRSQQPLVTAAAGHKRFVAEREPRVLAAS